MSIHNLSRKEFARRAGMSVSKLNKMYLRGELPPARRIGRADFWLDKVVDAWIIRAFDYPLEPPALPDDLQAEVDAAINKLFARRAACPNNPPTLA